MPAHPGETGHIGSGGWLTSHANTLLSTELVVAQPPAALLAWVLRQSSHILLLPVRAKTGIIFAIAAACCLLQIYSNLASAAISQALWTQKATDIFEAGFAATGSLFGRHH